MGQTGGDDCQEKKSVQRAKYRYPCQCFKRQEMGEVCQKFDQKMLQFRREKGPSSVILLKKYGADLQRVKELIAIETRRERPATRRKKVSRMSRLKKR